jgi:hypothetical protein
LQVLGRAFLVEGLPQTSRDLDGSWKYSIKIQKNINNPAPWKYSRKFQKISIIPLQKISIILLPGNIPENSKKYQ